MTIRTRLAAWYASLLALIIIIFSIAVFGTMQVTTLGTVDAALEEAATLVRQQIRVVPIPIQDRLTQIYYNDVSDLVLRFPGFSVQVWQTHDGNKVIDPLLNDSSSDIVGREEPLDANSLNVSTERIQNTTINDIPARVITLPFLSANGNQVGIIQVATPIQTLQQAFDSLLIIMLVASLLAIVISIGLGMWLAGRILKPIEFIHNAASNIAETDDLTTRLKWAGPMDELGQLANVFNRMMERLQYLFRVQQRFVGDVSHELRTPLTAIKGNLEIIEKYGMDNGEAFSAIQAETDRMSRMVNDLLLLTRVDYGDVRFDYYEFELDQVVLQVHEQTYILAKERDLKIILGRLEPITMEGNADRIRQMITNLVNNAVKFTPDGGTIKIETYKANGQAKVTVEDTGIGISQDDLGHIFDRFFQADHSRVHLSDNDGAGLGLSIVKWITDAHKGKIRVESEIDKGTCFEISLPLKQVGNEPYHNGSPTDTYSTRQHSSPISKVSPHSS